VERIDRLQEGPVGKGGRRRGAGRKRDPDVAARVSAVRALLQLTGMDEQDAYAVVAVARVDRGKSGQLWQLLHTIREELGFSYRQALLDFLPRVFAGDLREGRSDGVPLTESHSLYTFQRRTGGPARVEWVTQPPEHESDEPEVASGNGPGQDRQGTARNEELLARLNAGEKAELQRLLSECRAEYQRIRQQHHYARKRGRARDPLAAPADVSSETLHPGPCVCPALPVEHKHCEACQLAVPQGHPFVVKAARELVGVLTGRVKNRVSSHEIPLGEPEQLGWLCWECATTKGSSRTERRAD